MPKKQRLLVVILVSGLICLVAEADEPLAIREMERLWNDLGTDDAVKTDGTIKAFAAKLADTTTFLKVRLRPALAATPCRMARLLAGLDSDQFEERQKATRELERLAEGAEPILRKVMDGQPSPESGRRIQGILGRLRTERLRPSPDKRRAVRAIEVLEQIGNQEARQILADLARGASAAQLTIEAKTALERLAKQQVP
jgi:hypothetical protein